MKRRQYNDIKDNACEFLTKSASNDNGQTKTECKYYINIQDFLSYERKRMRGVDWERGKTSLMKRHHDNFREDIFYNYLNNDHYWKEIMNEIKETYMWNQKYWEHHQLFDATMKDMTGKRYNNFRRLWRCKVTKSFLNAQVLPEILDIIAWYWDKLMQQERQQQQSVNNPCTTFEKQELVKELLYRKGVESTKIPSYWY